MIAYWNRINHTLEIWLRLPQDFFLLGLRLWLVWIFFKSGLLKFQSWDVTLALFTYEYSVPLLPPEWAALAATLAELLLPPLLALGLLTRPIALTLLILNVVAALSYPDISAAGFKDHQLWSLALIWLSLAGAGKVSLDQGLAKWSYSRS